MRTEALQTILVTSSDGKGATQGTQIFRARLKVEARASKFEQFRKRSNLKDGSLRFLSLIA